MKIIDITDSEFQAYGKILNGQYDIQELYRILERKPVDDHVFYTAGDSELEALSVASELQKSLFGDMPIQVGYCSGKNKKLDAVEYHRNCEVSLNTEDMIIMLGKVQDIETDFRYDSSKIKCFFVPKGTLYLIYETTLHYTPCSIGNGFFKNLVVLPQGTNTELNEYIHTGAKEDKLLLARNKWLIAHPDAGIKDAFSGVYGDNLQIEGECV